MVESNEPTDEENTDKVVNPERKRRASTMSILTMDKSKSFYNKDYKKEHIGESREVRYFSAF